MRFIDFRNSIVETLRRHPDGLTWAQLKQTLQLPYQRPCPTWVRRMERENGLIRAKGTGRAYVWKILLKQEGAGGDPP